MRTTLLACILIALMGNGCMARQQNRMILDRLDKIDKALRERIEIKIQIQPNRPLGMVDEKAKRDT